MSSKCGTRCLAVFETCYDHTKIPKHAREFCPAVDAKYEGVNHSTTWRKLIDFCPAVWYLSPSHLAFTRTEFNSHQGCNFFSPHFHIE